MNIDMGWKGPLGTDLRIRNEIAYIGGTNHWVEWLHHFTPGAAWRERRWAREVVSTLDALGIPIAAVAGHSVGGTVACHVAKAYRNRGQNVRLYTYGAKPPGYDISGKHYAIKGDPVPALPPWRKRLNVIVLDHGDLTWREAHGPRSYYGVMEGDGVR